MQTAELGAIGDSREMPGLDEPEIGTFTDQNVLNLIISSGSCGSVEFLGGNVEGPVDVRVLIACGVRERNGELMKSRWDNSQRLFF
jgi:hypothetical protein